MCYRTVGPGQQWCLNSKHCQCQACLNNSIKNNAHNMEGKLHRPAADGPGSKPRFPEKFHAMLQAAQEAHIKAHHEGLQDRRSLSVAMLVEGRAEAFVDFFHLTQSSGFELPWQSMVLLQEQLVRADTASRDRDLQAAFDAHRTMAKHFTQLGMLQNAVFFWKKCLEVRGICWMCCLVCRQHKTATTQQQDLFGQRVLPQNSLPCTWLHSFPKAQAPYHRSLEKLCTCLCRGSACSWLQVQLWDPSN